MKKANEKAVTVLRQEKFFDSNKPEYMEDLVRNVQSIVDSGKGADFKPAAKSLAPFKAPSRPQSSLCTIQRKSTLF